MYTYNAIFVPTDMQSYSSAVVHAALLYVFLTDNYMLAGGKADTKMDAKFEPVEGNTPIGDFPTDPYMTFKPQNMT